jgi:hypothetical protein
VSCVDLFFYEIDSESPMKDEDLLSCFYRALIEEQKISGTEADKQESAVNRQSRVSRCSVNSKKICKEIHHKIRYHDGADVASVIGFWMARKNAERPVDGEHKVPK